MRGMIFLVVIFLTLPLAMARKPAVLPVSGLDIEKYNSSGMEGAHPGYDFTKNKPSDASEIAQNEIKALMAAAGAFTALIPFIYVFFFRNRSTETTAAVESSPSNVTSFPARSKTTTSVDETDKDQKWPKAS